MDLTKLFETQKVLRDRIDYNEPDRFAKLVLALLVELGECANEWRGFKFWSKDQEPRIKVPITGWGEPYKNPLLEEYVDGLHFVLEIGLEFGYFQQQRIMKAPSVEQQFNALFNKVGDLWSVPNKLNYSIVFGMLVNLGEMLGFSWEEIEEAYYKKNEINHERQDNGY